MAEIYGERIERVVLFGSRARGDARPYSDYDVAVFLRGMGDRFAEMDRLADLSTAILDETGGFIHAMPYRAGAYSDDRMPLMYEVRAEGIDLLSRKPGPSSISRGSCLRGLTRCSVSG